ncbi:cytochrome c [Alcaligenaceae bacterium]|nr:cytochrome c [Alcaligenaceae bacterium]
MDYKLLTIAGGSTLLYLVLSTLMAILPGIELSAVPPGPGVKDFTLFEQQGRDVFVKEGCAYCHTQQVRPLEIDKIFGRPSAPGDFAYSTPELAGSERTGPDLTNIGERQSSEVWQYMHLYNPRSVTPQSVMPSFPWLFKVVDKAPQDVKPVPVPKAYAPPHGVVVPGPDAQALVAFLLALKQAPLPNSAPAVAVAAASAAKPAQAATITPAADKTPLAFDAANGLKLFAANCAACHGAQGAGVPGVFPPLAGNPVVNAADPTEHITVVLNGLHGKAIDGTTYAAEMPTFAAHLSDAEIADIIGHERTSWGNHAPTITAKDVAAVRAKK